jgi:phospholipid/cholesterol/gamma-HCH transport system substrate-binding protein
LGIFISLGIAFFFAGIYFIGVRHQLFTGTFRMSGVFKDVSGLQAGNNVRFSGVNVGTIENINIISDTSVRVDMLIDENVRRFIRKNAEAVVGTEGLLGSKILIITPGTSGTQEIENNDFIATSEPIKIDDILKQLKMTGDNTMHITADLSTLVAAIRSGKGTLGKLLMDSTYLKIPIDNAARMTRDLAEIVSSLHSGKGTLGKLLMDSTYLKIPIDNLAQISGDLSEIVSGLRSGKGTFGKFTRDDAFYIHLDQTIMVLDSLLRDIKENPDRYVKLSLF